jgi:hypothetical protein
MARTTTGGRLDLLQFRPHGGAHRVAVRAGISVLTPLLVLAAVGRTEWTMYAAFGAFTSLYGRNHVHLSRAVMQLSAGAALVASVVGGTAARLLPYADWVAVALTGVVALLAATLALAQDWHPPGSLFPVFAFGACISVPHTARDLPTALVVSGLSALFSVAVGAVGNLWRTETSRPSRVRFHWSWLPLMDASAVVVAGAVATASTIGHPYWATVAAVAPLSVRGITGQVTKAVQRVLGTTAGLVTSAALLALDLRGLSLLLVIAVLQVGAELLVGRNYGVAMLCITPLALLMGQAAHKRPMADLLFDRGVETLIGAAVGLAVVLLAHRLRQVRARHAG